MLAILKSTARHALKHAVIRSILEAIALFGLDRRPGAAAGRGVIFTLHHVRPAGGAAFAPNRHLEITPEFLDEAIGVAKARGLVPVALEELPRLLADPSDTRRFCAFTLDDGYRDNLVHAAPVFRRHGVPFTVFVTIGFTTRTRTMWWETAARLVARVDRLAFDFGAGVETLECRSLGAKQVAFERLAHFVASIEEDAAVTRIDEAARAAGLDPVAMVAEEVMDVADLQRLFTEPLARLGAHTLTHPALSRLDEGRAREEMARSAEIIAEWIGQRPTTFAYPYGSRDTCGAREARIARELGFDVAVTTGPGVLGSADHETMTALPRVSLNGLYQKGRLVSALISGLPFGLVRG